MNLILSWLSMNIIVIFCLSASISLDGSRLIGSGSFSKVYLGTYRKRRCAIKLIFTPDLTEDVIQRIGAEALILSSIKVSSNS